MNKTAFLQIGDVHFPQTRTISGLDHKDRRFPPELALRIAEPRLKTMADAARRELLKRESIVGVLLSGDLTSWSDTSGYEECLHYLASALGTTDLWDENSLVAVPGNHDVDRDKNSSVTGDLYEKFREFEGLWSAMGLPVLSVETPVQRFFGARTTGTAAVFGMNSCLGCGEPMVLPPEVRREFKVAAERLYRKADKEVADRIIQGQLDTPAFDHEHINTVCGALDQLDENAVGVVLAHHNILPQALPRLDLYTELINSGYARYKLTSLRRPIVYCHGHIHDQPIEVVQHPDHPDAKLILVSAPRFDAGFNVLEVHYSRNGMPLGLEIIRMALQNGLNVVGQEAVRVPLARNRDTRRPRDSYDRWLLGAVPETPVYFEEVVKAARKAAARSLRQETIAERLRELEWIGLVAIRSRNSPPQYWEIERV